MDPNECLKRIRELAVRMLITEGDSSGDAVELAALVHSLDEWLSRGGFAPRDWHLKPESRMAALLADDEPNGV